MSTTPAGSDPETIVRGPHGATEAPARLAPAAETAGPAGGRLRSNRDFLLVLGGQGISSFGDAVTDTAMPILVLALTGSGTAMGVVGALATLPDLVIGLPAGAFADRWDRRRMMFLTDLGRCILTALIPLSVWLGGPALAVVIVVAFPLNVLRVLWLAAYTAVVPGLVGRDEVPRANAVFEAVFNVGWIVGPALAGFLSGAIGPGPTIAIDAATFVVSASTIYLVRRPLRAQAKAEKTHLLADVREGIVFVARQPTLRSVIALWTATSVITAGLVTGLIYDITIDRHLGPQIVGAVLSAFAVGSLGGAVVAARMALRAAGPIMLAGSATFGLTLLVFVTNAPAAVLVAGAFVAGVVNANVLLAYLTMRTLLSPDELLGRVGATARTLSVGLMPAGALVTGVLLDVVGGAATLAAMGLALVAAAIGFAVMPDVRHARIPRGGPPVSRPG